MRTIRDTVFDYSINIKERYRGPWRNDRALYDASYDLLKELPDKLRGVYFLYDGSGELLYVGKSVNIKQRLVDHVLKNSNTKHFIDEVEVVKCIEFDEDSDLDRLETNFIASHRPKHNVEKTEKQVFFKKKIK